jgi:hypothetical protein
MDFQDGCLKELHILFFGGCFAGSEGEDTKKSQ